MRRTALVYDPFNLKHTREGHPENYRRLERTWALLNQEGIPGKTIRIASTPASEDDVRLAHTQRYLDRLQSAQLLGGGHLDADTYMNRDSLEAALLAAGGSINVVDAVLSRRAENGFALVRPPGHHALSYTGMGFCLLANAAIAARWAQKAYGLTRVLIVDFDVHHGNGTQEVLYNDPSILFFSTHQYPFYPGTGGADERGDESGFGATINVPLPEGVGDAGYLDVFRRILAPAARRFKPQLIIVSAGYDAHWLDPLASMQLTVTGYAALVQELLALANELCGGRLVCLLEGGYNLDVLSHAVLTTMHMLLDDPAGISDPFGASRYAETEITQLVDRLERLHGLGTSSTFAASRPSSYW